MPAALYIVQIDDQREPRLAGHAGGTYTSPPQTAAQALALARVVIGQPDVATPGDLARWERPVAGGRLTVAIRRAERSVAQ